MELQEFIDKARAHGMNDEQIKHKLHEAGWEAADVTAAFTDNLDVPPPPPHGQHPMVGAQQTQPPHQPMAVVENLSPRGFEFKIYAATLLASLYGLMYLLNTFIYGDDLGSSSARAFPLTVLLVVAPIAVYMFLRLQKAEKVDPNFATDPSRRKSVQTIQLLTFLAVVIHTIAYVYLFVSGAYTTDSVSSSYSSYSSDYSTASSDHGMSIFKNTLSWLLTLGITGSVFLYYWRQEHKRSR